MIPPPATKTASKGAGQATYQSVCKVCHDAGVAGAPKVGDKTAWSARVKTDRKSVV